jgi:hypothetical protein
MIYLIDANVLIDANRDYYPIDRVPHFWTWLEEMAAVGTIQTPIEIYEEVAAGKDEVATWLASTHIKDQIMLKEEAAPAVVSRVIAQGYAPDLTDEEIERLGRDPFLIGAALADQGKRCVVTTEASRPSRMRANRHIPDVCAGFPVPCCNTFRMLRELDFRIP